MFFVSMMMVVQLTSVPEIMEWDEWKAAFRSGISRSPQEELKRMAKHFFSSPFVFALSLSGTVVVCGERYKVML